MKVVSVYRTCRKKRPLLRSKFSAQTPLALSLLLHLGLFVVAALILGLIRHLPAPPVPAAIAFSFLPEEPAATGAAEMAATPPPVPQRPDPAQPARSAPPPLTVDAPETDAPQPSTGDLTMQPGRSRFEKQAPLTTPASGTAMAELSPRPNYLPNADAPASLRSTRFYSPMRQHSVLAEKHFGEHFRLAPIRLKISAANQKRLLKKIEKLCDRLAPLAAHDSSFVLRDKNQIYNVTLEHIQAKTASDFDRLEIKITTEKYGKTLCTTLRMQRLGFSQFAQFVDYWNPRVMIHDDTFDGRFHTNTDFKISSRQGVHPKFLGRVTTSGYSVQPPGRAGFHSPDSIFIGGVETGIPVIAFPRHLRHLIAQTTADSLVKVFSEEAWVKFYRQGFFAYRVKSRRNSVEIQQLPAAPFIILGDCRRKLHVEGTLRGKVLVYNTGSIVVDGSITYAKQPEVVRNADDYLGLVSEKNIIIAPPEITGPGDLYIYAALLAKKQFVVSSIYRGGRARLHIYGSLSAGSLAATEPRYATRIRFDKRLERKRPPAFPMTDRYELLDWDEKWELLPEKRQ